MSGGIATSARRDPARALYRRSRTTGNSMNVKIAGRSVQRVLENTRAHTTTRSAATSGAPPRFDLPPESFNSPESLRVIEDQLKRGQFPEAAAQIESLLRDNADAITPVD